MNPTQGRADDARPSIMRGYRIWREIRDVAILVLAVLAFHSLIAKPFFIPSESMLPTLRVGDRLVVSKYPYGWSFASLSLPILPYMSGRLLGRLPERGDIVIIRSRSGTSDDYIKRVVGLPGERLEMRRGTLIINGVPVRRTRAPDALIPVDPNAPCTSPLYAERRIGLPDGRHYCRLPIMRETLPNGVSYDTLELVERETDDFMPLTLAENEVFLLGDNRDDSADSRVAPAYGGLGGGVPLEHLGGRAEFVTFSLNGTSRIFSPSTWLAAMRPDRAGLSLRTQREE